MSWLFSRALAEEYSAGNSSTGGAYAPLNVMPSPQPFWRNDRTMAASNLSRFGPTCAVLTAERGAALLMSYQAAFRVRTSARPAKAPASTAGAAGSGGKWHASFARWHPATSSWRTPQCSLFEGWDVFSEIWPRWGMMRGGECSEPVMPARRTVETESGFWPAPTCNGWRSEGAIMQLRKLVEVGALTVVEAEAMAEGTITPPRLGVWPTPMTHGLRGGSHAKRAVPGQPLWPTPHGFSPDGRSNGPSGNELGRAVNRSLWPTPTVHGNHNRKGVSPTSGDGLMTVVRQAEANFPTPTVAASKGSSPGSLTRKDGRSRVNDRLDHRVMAEHGGSLNPTWVEWLMGWPLGWTDLNASVTVRFRQWLHSHGGNSGQRTTSHPSDLPDLR